MKTLKESLLGDERAQINNQDAVLDMVKDYFKNPRIKFRGSSIYKFISFMKYDFTPGFNNSKFITSLCQDIGEYPGCEEAVKWMMDVYLKYLKNGSKDSIFSEASLYDEEAEGGVKNIDPRYVNKLLKSNSQIFKEYTDNLDEPNPITEFKNDIYEFIMFDMGQDWLDEYFFFWIPKKATTEEKEILHLIFDAILRSIRR